MMKLSRFLNSNRNALGKATDVRDGSALHALTFQAGISTAGKSSIQDRVFAPYSVFKGKAALSVEPVLPTFSKFGSGNLRVDRRGSMMLTFLPAIGERKYDHEKRQKFALSATEVGSLLSMGPKDSCEFFHDPSMLSSNAGQVRKNLSIKPHADGSGYFISLSKLLIVLMILFGLKFLISFLAFIVDYLGCPSMFKTQKRYFNGRTKIFFEKLLVVILNVISFYLMRNA
ncbi:hypothetical protein OIU84_004684 [Salix udensis]|uniref:Uncharacterized protein n=1 Tax=Salix udensis TaxID=889485 RepID=A0AAD6K2R3_9ROSI|nr:hypothetical protein OIU84_004684 [Salix udensis]